MKKKEPEWRSLYWASNFAATPAKHALEVQKIYNIFKKKPKRKK